MAYRFRRKETAADGLKRIIREQTAGSVSLLADRGNNIASRVHEARRHLKRMRAVLRLARESLDPDFFATHDAVLRNAGRRLSKTRDADVSLCTLEKLCADLPKPAFPELTQRLRTEADAARRAATHIKLGSIASAVRKSGQAIAQAELRSDGWSLLEPGIARSIRAARKTRHIIKATAEPCVVHRWRKRVKRLALQLELLCPALRKTERKMSRKLAKLSVLLGDYHDLDVLDQHARELRGKGIAASDEDRLKELVEREMKQLLRRMRPLAAECLNTGAKTLLRRLKRAWKTGHKASA